MGKGTGFGKTILIGDQFVVEKVPAVVSAIPYVTECIVERRKQGEECIVEDNRIEVPGYKEAKAKKQVESFSKMTEVMGIDLKKNPIKITVGGDLLAGSGVGASAAICVSFARACNEEFNLNLKNIDVNYIAWHGEFAYHGFPSGVDNTASTYGGLILYQWEENKKSFKRINLKRPVEVVLGNSGITADTAKLDGFLKEQKKADKKRYQSRLSTIKAQAQELYTAITAFDLVKTGAIMSENHKLLKEMGLSHKRLDELCELALSLGALGVKVTGGGRGGYMQALTPGRDLQEKVAKAFEERKVPVIRATIGNKPTDPVQSQVLK